MPAFVRWPGHIKPGSVTNEIVHHMDWMPTLLAAAGVPDIKEKLLNGYEAIGRNYKVHLDGYNILPGFFMSRDGVRSIVQVHPLPEVVNN